MMQSSKVTQKYNFRKMIKMMLHNSIKMIKIYKKILMELQKKRINRNFRPPKKKKINLLTVMIFKCKEIL